MMVEKLEAGRIVRSVAGHDAGSFYAVVDIREGFCYIADGHLRKLESPKKKNPAHLRLTDAAVDLTQVCTNRQLAAALRPYNTPEGGTAFGQR